MKGRWCYLYHAINHEGNLVDSLLSATRELSVAQRLFQSALSIAEQAPQQVTTDGHDSYPGRSERFWARRSSIATMLTSTAAWSRTIEELNSATTRC